MSDEDLPPPPILDDDDDDDDEGPPPPILGDNDFLSKPSFAPLKKGIPKNPCEITLEYLEEKLQLTGKLKSFKFTNLSTEGYASAIKRLHLEYHSSEDDCKSPKTMIVKMTGPYVILKSAKAFHQTEFDMWGILEKRKDEFPNFPEIHYREINPKNANFIFFMEDLGAEVKKSITMEEAKMVLKTLAKFQCMYWNKCEDLKEVLPDGFLWYGLFYCNRRKVDESRFNEENEKKIIRVFENVEKMVMFEKEEMELLKKIDFSKIFKEYVRKMFRKDMPRVIVHGDFRLDNQLFTKDSNEVKFIDWQLSNVGNPLVDVNCYLNCANIENVDFDELMKYYYSCLNEKIKKDFSFEDCLEESKICTVYIMLLYYKIFKKGDIENIKMLKPELYKFFEKGKVNTINSLKKFFDK